MPTNWRALVESNSIRMCALLVSLPAVSVPGVVSRENEPLRLHVERVESVAGCPVCGIVAHVKDRRRVELVDLPSFGRPARLIWHKRQFCCPEPSCPPAPGRSGPLDRTAQAVSERPRGTLD